ARSRRTRGLSGQATPGVRSTTLVPALRSAGGGRLEHGGNRRLAVEPLKAALGRRHEVDRALAMADENVLGPHPLVSDRLGGVVQRRLPLRRGADEEPRIEPPWCSLGRDPATDVVHAVRGEAQIFGRADVCQRPFAAGDGLTVDGEALRRGRIVEVDDLAGAVDGEKDPGLLEALAYGRGP